MRVDVTSVAWCLWRVRWYGLRVEPHGVSHTWDGGWTAGTRARLRADAPTQDRPGIRALDADPDSPEARMWVLDACTDELHVRREHERWQMLQRATSCDAASALERVRLLDAILDNLHPSPAIVDATIRAYVAEARGVAQRPARDPDAPVTVQRAAEALGWPVEVLAAMVRRGEVRRVKVGARWHVPLSEVERLASKGAP